MKKKREIYLDHAAAVGVERLVMEKMRPYFEERFFNPSAPYLPARRVRMEYEAAKHEIARVIGARGSDLVMTGGATESVNLAFTAAEKVGGEVLVAAGEHAAVWQAAAKYRRKEIRMTRKGVVDLEDLERKVVGCGQVAIVSVALAGGETGVVQPIFEISQIIEKERRRREEAGEKRPIYLHTDASQAIGLLDVKVKSLGVDMMTLSAAKVGGIKGVGALYVGRGVELVARNVGGGQERGLRSGTENVAGVVGFAEAMGLAEKRMRARRKKYDEWYELMVKELEEGGVDPSFLVNRKKQLANFLVVSFLGLDAERILYGLEELGVYVGTGAACAASKGEKARGLVAMGCSEEEINGSLRISFGESNDKKQIKEAGRLLVQVVRRERERNE